MTPRIEIAKICILHGVEWVYKTTVSEDQVNVLARRICRVWPDIHSVVDKWTAENNLQIPAK